MLDIQHIGRPLNRPDWPEAGTLAGLFDALSRWVLDPTFNMMGDPQLQPHPLRGPYKGPALRCAGRRYDPATGFNVYLHGAPVYPDAPNAVSYCGNFAGYSFAFNLATDDPELIARLDAAIAWNLANLTE